MSKPRVFVSSTYYDLKYIRAGIEAFIKQMGYDPVLFEHGSIPFHHDKSIEENCLQEVNNADILILIIGGRFGAASKEDEEKARANPDDFFARIRSVTNKKYENARSREIPIFVFIESSVFSEYRTYKENIGNNSIKYAHVDNPKIFEMVADIMGKPKNNFVKDFMNLEDITDWLEEQWAGIFAEFLKRRSSTHHIKNLETQIANLGDVVNSLRKYNEEIIRAVTNKSVDSEKLIKDEEDRLINSQIMRFSRESLIHFLRSSVPRNSEEFFGEQIPLRKHTARRTFEYFLSSPSLTTFLHTLYGDEFAMKFMERFKDAAERDFADMKLRYGGVVEPDVADIDSTADHSDDDDA